MEQSPNRLWEKLLDYIEERRVIPVVGPELIVPAGDDAPALYRVIADRLAAKFGIPMDGLPAKYSLNEVVCRFHRAAETVHKDDLYREVRSILRTLPAEPPQPLLDLASITDFDLFVSLTFDSLLSQAIDAQRHGGEQRTERIHYSYADVQDLHSDRKSLAQPVVFQLFGRASASPDYVICDEDVLEFLNGLQDKARQPARLLDELGRSHLLIIGSGLSDWLARFFIRIAKRQPLSMKRHMEIVVGPELTGDPNLVTFVSAFSRETHLFPGQPVEFVAELARRWRERNPAPAAGTTPPPTARAGAFMKPGAIFLSYARQNIDAAKRLGAEIEAAGMDVWLDLGELQAGDAWDAKIRLNVEACSLFLPLVSRETEAREEAYFRREWNLASERALAFADDVPFILPVAIDDTPPYSARVPERFRRSNWTSLPEGRTTPEFAQRLKQLVRDYHRRQKSAA